MNKELTIEEIGKIKNYIKGKKISRRIKKIIKKYYEEEKINKQLNKLYENCEKNKLCMGKLTNMYGDCLFESLNYHGIGEDVESLRKGLAMILYIYKNDKEFLPSKMSLKEMYEMSMDEEIEKVYYKEKKEKKYTKYGYNVMCQDLTVENSWERIPANIILILVSYLYKVEIITVVDYETKNNGISPINFWNEIEHENEIEKIYIGHICDNHWIPIKEKEENKELEEEKNEYYTKETEKFNKWAKEILKKIEE